jgi:hypothetical protein
MRLPNHFNPDHFLNLAEASVVTKHDVQAAWERTYEELQEKLLAIGPAATLYVVFGIQGAGKTTWIQRNAPELGPTALFLDGPLPSSNKRARALRLAREAGCKTVAVWVDTPFEVAMVQNSLRPGLARISEEAMLHVQGQLEPPALAEGFAEVIHVSRSAIEA